MIVQKPRVCLRGMRGKGGGVSSQWHPEDVECFGDLQSFPVVISLFVLKNTQETLASLLHHVFFKSEIVSLLVPLFVLSISFIFFFNAFYF